MHLFYALLLLLLLLIFNHLVQNCAHHHLVLIMPGIIDDGTTFCSFLQGWLSRQTRLMFELQRAQQSLNDSHSAEINDLVARVLAHYQEYFEEKSRMAHRNVFLMFSPPWFTPLERAYLWIAGFKPGVAFNLVEVAVNDLSTQQSQRLETLKNEVRSRERELLGQYARVQETVAAPPLADQARQGANREQPVDAILEPLRAEMENLVREADTLRTRTAESVVEILSPVQKVKYLAAAAEVQIGIRTTGLQQRQVAENSRRGFPVENGW